MSKKGYYNPNGHKNTENENKLAEESRKARACGLSYGQYMARKEAEKVKVVKKTFNKTNEGVSA